MEVKTYEDALATIATELAEVITHNGALKQFNLIFIYKGNGTFTQEDYQKVARAEQIRNASDYDDFYLASEEEARQQVKNAEYLVDKVEKYMIDLYA